MANKVKNGYLDLIGLALKSLKVELALSDFNKPDGSIAKKINVMNVEAGHSSDADYNYISK